MDTEILSNINGNVQTLRKMWSIKGQEKDEPLRPVLIPPKSQPPKDKLPVLRITNDVNSTEKMNKPSTVIPNNERRPTFESVDILPPIEEHISLPLPPPPPSIIFKGQVKTVATLQHSINKMNNHEKQKLLRKEINNGVHRWHITRHVFRSGLIFNRSRRASDSILPILMKTHQARSRTDSLDSTLALSPFAALIDYIGDDKNNSLKAPKKMKRSTSDASHCLRRNKLDDSIFQYEMILRHLKNYDQFMTTFPVPSFQSVLTKQQQKSYDSETKENFRAKTSIQNRQTKSLSRNIGRTFSEFIVNDLFLSSTNERRCSSISHASSQTDLSEPIHEINEQTTNDVREISDNAELERKNSVSQEEAKAVLNELDTMLNENDRELSLTPNSEINVVVINSPELTEVKIVPKEKPLMQRLFENKKTAYSPNDLNMQKLRLPEELMPTYEIAKTKCFFDDEQLLYTSKMIKISRRGYKQHIRLLCITTKRLYNLTKKDPYPKEAILFKQIVGITCTPHKDGFICIHTQDSNEDRGDWIIVVDNPCEFLTQLFMVMGRNHNNDDFLKFKDKFTHCRRFYAESSSSDCTIEARIADSFRIKVADFDTLIIFTP